MIIFDLTMFLSNNIERALNDFSEVYITIPTFEALDKLRRDPDVIISKKATKAIDLIFKNPNKILFSAVPARELSASTDNTFYFGDKYNYLYYNNCVGRNTKAKSSFYSYCQDFSFPVISQEKIDFIETFFATHNLQ